MSLSLRRATLDDAPALAANHLRAYPMISASAAARTEHLLAQRIWPIDTITVAERAGVVVGQARTIPFRGWLGGRETRVGGLAAVAVAPEARRAGVASALVRDHLAALRAGGTPWSMLYPFAPSFYARLGWRQTARRTRWRFPPAALPVYPERGLVTRLALDSTADFTAIQACYAAYCARTSGSLSRSDELLRWDLDGPELAVGVRDAAGGLAGYLIYTVRAPTPRPQTLVVRELVTLDPIAERALLGFLATQADQISHILLDTPVEHPLGSLITWSLPEVETHDQPNEHLPVGTVYQGLMVRIVDLAGALVGRGYPGGNGAVSFAAADRELPANEAPVTLVVAQGAVRVQPGVRSGAPLVRGEIGELSRVLTGGMRLADAVRLGLVEVDGDAAWADGLLGLPVPFPLVIF